jgi:hypothetical protein
MFTAYQKLSPDIKPLAYSSYINEYIPFLLNTYADGYDHKYWGSQVFDRSNRVFDPMRKKLSLSVSTNNKNLLLFIQDKVNITPQTSKLIKDLLAEALCQNQLITIDENGIEKINQAKFTYILQGYIPDQDIVYLLNELKQHLVSQYHSLKQGLVETFDQLISFEYFNELCKTLVFDARTGKYDFM